MVLNFSNECLRWNHSWIVHSRLSFSSVTSVVLVWKVEERLIVIRSRLVYRTTTGNGEKSDLPQHGLVRDGTPCGDNLICLNQTCTSIFPYIDQLKCPTNNNNQECSGRGVSKEASWILISSLLKFTRRTCSNLNLHPNLAVIWTFSWSLCQMR